MGSGIGLFMHERGFIRLGLQPRLITGLGDFFYAHFKIADAYWNCDIAQTEAHDHTYKNFTKKI